MLGLVSGAHSRVTCSALNSSGLRRLVFTTLARRIDKSSQMNRCRPTSFGMDSLNFGSPAETRTILYDQEKTPCWGKSGRTIG